MMDMALVQTTPSAEEVVLWEMEVKRIREKFIDSVIVLCPRNRHVFYMRFFKGHTFRHIAEHHNISTARARQIYTVQLQKIERFMEIDK